MAGTLIGNRLDDGCPGVASWMTTVGAALARALQAVATGAGPQQDADDDDRRDRDRGEPDDDTGLILGGTSSAKSPSVVTFAR